MATKPLLNIFLLNLQQSFSLVILLSNYPGAYIEPSPPLRWNFLIKILNDFHPIYIFAKKLHRESSTMVVHLLQNQVEKKLFLKKKIFAFFAKYTLFAEKNVFIWKKTFLTEKNINENVKNIYLISETYFYTENVCHK